MNVAFAVWNGRIAPVFDAARQLHLVRIEAGRIAAERDESILDEGPTSRALRLAGLEVDVLVCGAISRQLQGMIAAYGVRVVPFIAGDLREVLRAFLSGEHELRNFTTPGPRRQHGRNQRGRGREYRATGRGEQ
jgi:predicted Fe-Mo cluster-binding NifX family protein